MTDDYGQLWTTAGLVLGFALTTFSWRIGREVKVADKDDLTWLAPADLLNLAAMIVAAGGVFVLPILDIGDADLASFWLGLAILLFVGHAIALAGHYELFNPSTPRSFVYFPRQEAVAVFLAAAVVVIYVLAAYMRDIL